MRTQHPCDTGHSKPIRPAENQEPAVPDATGKLWSASLFTQLCSMAEAGPGVHPAASSRRPTSHLLQFAASFTKCFATLTKQRSLESHGFVLPAALGNAFTCSPLTEHCEVLVHSEHSSATCFLFFWCMPDRSYCFLDLALGFASPPH